MIIVIYGDKVAKIAKRQIVFKNDKILSDSNHQS